MAFKEHPDFPVPESGDTTIWRYMDFTKFLSLLVTEELYFSRMDKLDDPFEGHYTPANISFNQMEYSDLPDDLKESDAIPDEETFNVMRKFTETSHKLAKHTREVSFVNCWHAQEHESAAMWSQYLKSNDGIAIRSSYTNLIESFKQYGDFEIHIGMVRYLDYKSEGISVGNLLSPCMHKRKSFEHEKEMRCLIWTPQHGKNHMFDPEKNRYENEAGLYVPVSLDILIQDVYISPTAPCWIRTLAENVVDKYDLSKIVRQSELSEKPIY